MKITVAILVALLAFQAPAAWAAMDTRQGSPFLDGDLVNSPTGAPIGTPSTIPFSLQVL